MYKTKIGIIVVVVLVMAGLVFLGTRERPYAYSPVAADAFVSPLSVLPTPSLTSGQDAQVAPATDDSMPTLASVLPTPSPVPTPTPSPTCTPFPEPWELTLPVPDGQIDEWTLYTGVGYTLRLPPGWSGGVARTQGGVRNAILYRFDLWDEGQRLAASIEVTAGTWPADTEVAHSIDSGPRRGYLMEPVTVQGHPAWWLHPTEPQPVTGLSGAVWIEWEDQTYRFFLRCQPELFEECQRLLWQVLYTLRVTS